MRLVVTKLYLLLTSSVGNWCLGPLSDSLLHTPFLNGYLIILKQERDECLLTRREALQGGMRSYLLILYRNSNFNLYLVDIFSHISFKRLKNFSHPDTLVTP